MLLSFFLQSEMEAMNMSAYFRTLTDVKAPFINPKSSVASSGLKLVKLKTFTLRDPKMELCKASLGRYLYN